MSLLPQKWSEDDKKVFSSIADPINKQISEFKENELPKLLNDPKFKQVQWVLKVSFIFYRCFLLEFNRFCKFISISTLARTIDKQNAYQKKLTDFDQKRGCKASALNNKVMSEPIQSFQLNIDTANLIFCQDPKMIAQATINFLLFFHVSRIN